MPKFTKFDNIRELGSMMNKLKQKDKIRQHELRDPDLKGKGF